jgi:hypothetical protein
MAEPKPGTLVEVEVPHDEAYPPYPERPDEEAYTPETLARLKDAGLL